MNSQTNLCTSARKWTYRKCFELDQATFYCILVVCSIHTWKGHSYNLEQGKAARSAGTNILQLRITFICSIINFITYMVYFIYILIPNKKRFQFYIYLLQTLLYYGNTKIRKSICQSLPNSVQ